MTLEDILDLHVSAVRKVASNVDPHGDIAPMLGIWRDCRMLDVVVFELPADRKGRQAMHEYAMRLLACERADAYTFAMAAWMSGVLSQQELAAHLASDLGVADRADRQEIIVAIAGDCEETLAVDLEIVRSQTGRIAELKRRERLKGISVGLFHDLLLRVPRDQVM